jgi:hypothetical protein
MLDDSISFKTSQESLQKRELFMPFIDKLRSISFTDEELQDTVCPVGEHLGEDKWRFSGTGFYISESGIALSAAHNFILPTDGVRNPDNCIKMPILIRVIPDGYKAVRIELVQVRQVILVDQIDVAILFAAVADDSHPKRLGLAATLPEIGEEVYCFSCPNTDGNIDNITGKLAINHSHYAGEVIEHLPHGRDRTFLPGPCFAIKMDATGGTSGGPVFNSDGNVCGVISTSMSGASPITYATPILPILDTSFEISTDLGVKVLTLREIASLGHISLMP